jgi:hypothetical protein
MGRKAGLPRDAEGFYVAGQAFIVTVGIPMVATQGETNHHCAAVIRAIERAGYRAGPASNDSMRAIVDQMDLIDGIVQERSVYDEPPGGTE